VIESRNSEELTVCGISETLENLLTIICGCFKNNYLSEEQNNGNNNLNNNSNNGNNTVVIINAATIKVLYASYSLIVNNVDNKNL